MKTIKLMMSVKKQMSISCMIYLCCYAVARLQPDGVEIKRPHEPALLDSVGVALYLWHLIATIEQCSHASTTLTVGITGHCLAMAAIITLLTHLGPRL
jgi:hypothetical protein